MAQDLKIPSQVFFFKQESPAAMKRGMVKLDSCGLIPETNVKCVCLLLPTLTSVGVHVPFQSVYLQNKIM